MCRRQHDVGCDEGASADGSLPIGELQRCNVWESVGIGWSTIDDPRINLAQNSEIPMLSNDPNSWSRTDTVLDVVGRDGLLLRADTICSAEHPRRNEATRRSI